MGVLTAKRCCCSCLAFCSVAFGVFFVLLGIWATHLKHRFTPVYTDIVCSMSPPKLKRISLEGGLEVDLISTTTCDNPNPYSVELRSTKTEKVYMGQDRKLVASVTDIPHATLPAKGNGSVAAKIAIRPTGDMVPSLLGGLFGEEIPIYIENNMELVIDINFLLGSFSKTKAFNKDCGMSLKVAVFGGGSEIGPLVCGDSFDSLTIPPADHPMTGEMHISAVGMAKDEIDKATKLKDELLGAAMGIGYGLGISLLVIGSCGLWCLCRGGSSARELGDLAKPQPPPTGTAGCPANTTCELRAMQIGAAARTAPEEV